MQENDLSCKTFYTRFYIMPQLSLMISYATVNFNMPFFLSLILFFRLLEGGVFWKVPYIFFNFNTQKCNFFIVLFEIWNESHAKISKDILIVDMIFRKFHIHKMVVVRVIDWYTPTWIKAKKVFILHSVRKWQKKFYSPSIY